MKNCSFVLLILILQFKTAFAQDLAGTLDFADKQFKNQDFVGAADTYERVLFFDTTLQFANGIYIKLAECLFRQQKLEEAARQYEKAYYVTTSDSLQNYICFKRPLATY